MTVHVLHLGYPSAGDDLHITVERAAIQRAIDRASLGAAFRLHEHDDVPLAELPQLLEDLRPQILHINTHGTDLGLVLKVGGEHQHVPAERLRELLDRGPDSLRLVVLRACYSRSTAAALGRADRPVIGAAIAVPTLRAAELSGTLYGLLASGVAPHLALSEAQAATLQLDPRCFDGFKLAPPDAQPAPLVSSLPAPTAARGVQRTRQGSPPRQIILHLDAYVDNPSSDEVIHRLDELDPWHESRPVLRLSDFCGVRLSHQDPRPIPWPSLREGVRRLLEAAEQHRPGDGRQPDFVLSGHAPHAVYAQVGYQLGTWGGARQYVLHRNPNRTWIDLVLGAEGPTGRRYFDLPTGLDLGQPSQATGLVWLYLASKPGTWREPMEAFFRDSGLPRAGVVALEHTWCHPDRPDVVSDLDGAFAASAARELEEVAGRIWSLYPGCQGVVLACNGPDMLAFLAARALNPRVMGDRPLHVLWKGTGGYHDVLRLPLARAAAPAPSMAPEDVLRRQEVYRTLARGMRSLAGSSGLIEEDLAPPRGFGRAEPGLARRVLSALETLKPAEVPATDVVFKLSSRRRELALGHGLCEALRDLDEPTLERIGRLFLLHELVHEPLGLKGTNYQGVGRAGVVLEDIDYWADALALHAVLRWEVRQGGPRAVEGAGQILRDYLDAHLGALCAFDRSEQGEGPLARLPERRLRRYLIWALQRARAELAHSPADVAELLSDRLLVELAPLDGWADDRGDKIAHRATEDSELFVGLAGWFARLPRSAGNFEPGELLRLARDLRIRELAQRLAYVVDQHEAALSAWSGVGPEAAPPPPGRSRRR